MMINIRLNQCIEKGLIDRQSSWPIGGGFHISTPSSSRPSSSSSDSTSHHQCISLRVIQPLWALGRISWGALFYDPLSPPALNPRPKIWISSSQLIDCVCVWCLCTSSSKHVKLFAIKIQMLVQFILIWPCIFINILNANDDLYVH